MSLCSPTALEDFFRSNLCTAFIGQKMSLALCFADRFGKIKNCKVSGQLNIFLTWCGTSDCWQKGRALRKSLSKKENT